MTLSSGMITAAPFWQEGKVPALESIPLPAEVDVLVVGGGYTGLSAARETAAAGLSTLVLEAAGTADRWRTASSRRSRT
jgi:glycerol-3-phosphate dehydrogenase